MGLTWEKALSWRLRRQFLDPVGTGSVADVVRRLGAVPAWPDAAAEGAIGVRRTDGHSGDAAAALHDGHLVKAYTFRGATHLMTPQDAGAYLAVRASSRMWERPSWQRFYDLEPSDWPKFREFVRRTLDRGPLTRWELVAALNRSSRYRHLGSVIAEGSETLLKPLTWLGDMGLGPVRGGEATFLRLDDVPGWAGIPDLEDAGPRLLEGYFSCYGPVSVDRVHQWFGEGLGAKRKDITRWLSLLEDRLDPITIEGDHVLVLHDDAEDLQNAPVSTAIRLLPGRDPWVMAPGTTDTRVVPAARREVVSRSANLVLAGGGVSGTWKVRGQDLSVEWFKEAGEIPRTELDQEVNALAAFLGRPLEATLNAV